MDSTEREAHIQRMVAAWNANDWAALEAAVTPDSEVIGPRGWPETGTFKGWSAVRGQFERLKEPWDEERIELLGVEPNGGRVLMHFKWVARGHASGLEIEQRMWTLSSFDGHRVSRMEYFDEEAAARQAAEVGEPSK